MPLPDPPPGPLRTAPLRAWPPGTSPRTTSTVRHPGDVGGGSRRLGRGFWALLCFWLLALAGGSSAWAQAQELRSATLIRPGAAAVDAPAGPSISLPAHGEAEAALASGEAQLRLRFDRPAGSTGLWAAQVPMSCGWLDVDLNGQALHRDPVDPSLAPRCPQSRWFSLPGVLLRDGTNVLDIRVRGSAAGQTTSVRRTAMLSTVWVGPDRVLQSQHAVSEFFLTTAVRIVCVALMLLGGFMLMLAANRHGDHLADFALAAWAWAAVLAPVWWTQVPMRPAWLDLLLTSLVGPAVAFGVQFLLRFANLDLARVRTVMLAQCLLMPLSLALIKPALREPATLAWMAVFGTELVAALVAYLVVCWRERRRDAWTMVGILVLVAACLAIESAAAPDGLGHHAVAWVVGSPYAAGSMLMALGVQLLHLFSRALVSAEESRQSLETRVQEITVQIENNFSQLSEMRVEQLTQKERKRIAADLHDDLGAKLLTIVHTCENERIAALGREALDDMRLSVRGLNGKPMRLADAMADWRAETVQRLGQTNIQVAWNSPNDEVDYLLPARAFVQTTRILREAVSNIIKHSGASRCQVTCFAGKGEFGIVIEDNGRGITVDYGMGMDRGNGLASMKNRAKQLQGQCLVESGPGVGTVIRLTLPL